MPYYTKDPKREHSFDNHPCVFTWALSPLVFVAVGGCGGSVALVDPLRATRTVHKCDVTYQRVNVDITTVEARKLEDDCPSTPKPREEGQPA